MLHVRERLSSRCGDRLRLAVALLSRAFREATRRSGDQLQYCSTACCARCRIPTILEEHKSTYASSDQDAWVPALWLETKDVNLPKIVQTQIRHLARLLLVHANMGCLIERLQRCDLRPQVFHALASLVRCVFLLPQCTTDAFQLATAYSIGGSAALGTHICEVIRAVLWSATPNQPATPQTPVGATLLRGAFVTMEALLEQNPIRARQLWCAMLPWLQNFDGIELCHSVQGRPGFVLLDASQADRLRGLIVATDRLYAASGHCFRRSQKRRLDVPFLIEHRLPKTTVEARRTASLHVYVASATSHVVGGKSVSALKAKRLEDFLSLRLASARLPCHRDCVHTKQL